MKPLRAILGIIFFIFFFYSCNDNSTEKESTTGTLIFEAVKQLPKFNYQSEKYVRSANTEGVFLMHTTDFKLTVTEIWISQGTIKEGAADNLTWHKIGENNQEKFFNEYSFTAEDLPVGLYQSIKITFKNLFYRIAAYQSDPSVTITMKERMGDWIGECENFEALAPTNYLCSSGNYLLENNRFKVVNPKEKVSGFEIKPGKITKLYWKLGDERPWDPYSCTFEWIDENNNGVWDCGVDRMDNFNCTMDPPLETMWMFIAEYE